ncbi:DUF397 domain-containing protein [Actinomadura latina]|uniref:DUF397 domain-containing protein n=1 Tax=Actinomadura latina TaxID=163603 RepID=A0A846YVQ3_9ACTN|nr:DUF397 domain-containing protein [Actinomadura latina]NKZ02163.1 DUF397 domain-containing protein [Actinomadura latina]
MVYRFTRGAALNWRKSSASAGGSDCVEVAALGSSVLVRDSRDPSAGAIALGRAQWNALVDAARGGDLDLV